MLNIWLISDGKRGHENQSLGLIEALCRKTNCKIATVSVRKGWPYFFYWLSGRFPANENQPRPDIVIGAGHAAHWAILAARRAQGGKAIVLMKPSLPLSWFDRVIVPEHDNLKPRANLLSTRGPINRIQPGTSQNANSGLMLIGGPSSEYGWNETALLKQIHLIALHQPEVAWTLTTSRRTPQGLLSNVDKLGLNNIKTIAYDKVDSNWLPQHLAQSAQAWVTPDSASMVYEALTSGASVGCFELPYLQPGRVALGLKNLVKDGYVTEFSEWERCGKLKPNSQPLDEAERCADKILQWLKTN